MLFSLFLLKNYELYDMIDKRLDLKLTRKEVCFMKERTEPSLAPGVPDELPAKERRKWSFRFGAVEFFYWFALAANNYLTIFLESRGYSVAQVSLINSVNSGVAIISTPLGGTFADKLRSSRKALSICLACMVVMFILIPLTADMHLFGFPVMLIFIVLGQFFRGPTWPLLDTTVINGCNKTGSFYGLVRSAGSFSFVVMNLVLGAVIVEENSYLTFYVLAIFLLPCVYYLYKLREVSDSMQIHSKPISFREMPFGKLFKNPYFIAYVIFSIARYIPETCVGTFQPYLVKEVGGNMALVGFIQAYRASFEIPTLLLSNKLDKRMSYRTMVILSAVFYGAQALLYGVVDSFGMMIVVTTLSGIASGFTQAGAARFVLTLAPRELQATAQTLVGSTMSIAGIIGGVLGGLMIESMGIRSFYIATGLMMVATVALYTLSFPFIRKVMKREFVDYSKVY